MYNATTLKTGLINLLAWRQNPDPDGWQLADLQTGLSGMYFNDEHPLLTFDNLVSIAPQFSEIHPLEADQELAFEAWLKEKTEAGIIRAVQTWIDRKFEVKTARNLLERQQLFSTAPSTGITDANEGKLVGFEFAPSRARGLKLNIERIGLSLTTNQTLNVYLFKSGRVAPVTSSALAYTGGGGEQWFDVNWSLDGEGAYYVGYFQSNLGGASIRGVLDFTYSGGGNRVGWPYFPIGRYFEAIAFGVPPPVAPVLWDIADNQYTVSTNYGLNFRLNVQCDYTDFILEQKDLFKTAIAKQVACDLLRELAYNANTRVNRKESNASQAQILYEVDGDSQGRPGGMKKQLDAAINSITFDTKGLDAFCLPCRKRSVNYKTI